MFKMNVFEVSLLILGVSLQWCRCIHLTNPDVCADVYIWYADGSVSCSCLTDQTCTWNFQPRAEYFCSEYSQTDCCITCNALGFPRTTSTGSPSNATTTTLITTPTTVAPTATTDPDSCDDQGIWIKSRLVSCKYLVRRSRWRIHRYPEYYCFEYPQTNCCKTCRGISRSDK